MFLPSNISNTKVQYRAIFSLQKLGEKNVKRKVIKHVSVYSPLAVRGFALSASPSHCYIVACKNDAHPPFSSPPTHCFSLPSFHSPCFSTHTHTHTELPERQSKGSLRFPTQRGCRVCHRLLLLISHKSTKKRCLPVRM